MKVTAPGAPRGETKEAIALRLFVEQHGPDGEWHGPPWGVALQTKPSATTVR